MLRSISLTDCPPVAGLLLAAAGNGTVTDSRAAELLCCGSRPSREAPTPTAKRMIRYIRSIAEHSSFRGKESLKRASGDLEQLAFPGNRIADDPVDVRILGLPVERLQQFAIAC